MNERDAALRKLSAAQFAEWELRIYLDTHPGDQEAMEKYKQYQKKTTALKESYEAGYGPLNIRASGSSDQWLNNPWPWDYKEDDE